MLVLTPYKSSTFLEKYSYTTEVTLPVEAGKIKNITKFMHWKAYFFLTDNNSCHFFQYLVLYTYIYIYIYISFSSLFSMFHIRVLDFSSILRVSCLLLI